MCDSFRASRIPVDIWCEIAIYLDVESLVCLGATSKEFSSLLNTTRSIWFRKVASVVRDECLAPHSVSVLNSDAAALKSIATRAGRALFAIRRRRFDGTSHKLPAHVLNSRLLEYLQDDGLGSSFQFHQVLPGGRWLLTANSSQDISQICCWDLHQLSRAPVCHRFRNRLAIFDDADGDETTVVFQASPEEHAVNIMVRTCNADGEYDIDIVRLSWISPGPHLAASAKFEHINRLIPCGVYIEAAYLEESLACVGCGPDWIFWDWRNNSATRVNLESASGENTVHLMLCHDAFFSVSKAGRISMFLMPPLQPIASGRVEVHTLTPVVSSESYGTLRQAMILNTWIPIHLRPASLVCLKTTIVTREAVEARAFACRAILLDYGPTHDGATGAVDPGGMADGRVGDLLPRTLYFGRGNLDWHGVFNVSHGTLLERSVQIVSRVQAPSRPVPHLWFDVHHVFRVRHGRRKTAPFPGALVLDTARPVSPANEEEFRQGLSVCYTTGRVVLIRPRIRCVEIFDFE